MIPTSTSAPSNRRHALAAAAMAVVHRVAAIACLVVVVAATGLAVVNILAVVGMALGSIGLAGADRVAAHSLVVVIAIDRAVLEVAAYISPSILTL